MAYPASPVGSSLHADPPSPHWYCAALELPPVWHPGSGLTSADNRRSAGGIKAIKQCFNGTRLRQTLAEQPECSGIRHAVCQTQTEKTPVPCSGQGGRLQNPQPAKTLRADHRARSIGLAALQHQRNQTASCYISPIHAGGRETHRQSQNQGVFRTLHLIRLLS